jgi:hypothetical protein
LSRPATQKLTRVVKNLWTKCLPCGSRWKTGDQSGTRRNSLHGVSMTYTLSKEMIGFRLRVLAAARNPPTVPIGRLYVFKLSN